MKGTMFAIEEIMAKFRYLDFFKLRSLTQKPSCSSTATRRNVDARTKSLTSYRRQPNRLAPLPFNNNGHQPAAAFPLPLGIPLGVARESIALELYDSSLSIFVWPVCAWELDPWSLPPWRAPHMELCFDLSPPSRDAGI